MTKPPTTPLSDGRVETVSNATLNPGKWAEYRPYGKRKVREHIVAWTEPNVDYTTATRNIRRRGRSRGGRQCRN